MAGLVDSACKFLNSTCGNPRPFRSGAWHTQWIGGVLSIEPKWRTCQGQAAKPAELCKCFPPTLLIKPMGGLADARVPPLLLLPW
eukprot:2988444-Amphidinium_carterae.1